MKRRDLLLLSGYVLSPVALAAQETKARGPWPAARATAWYKRRGWRVGCNFIPSNAINQLEMWQPETFDPVTIDRELGWAQALGFNSARVFLHDLLWTQDATGFLSRIDKFLTLAQRRGIGVLLVLFDSVWNPEPRLGKQPEPRPRVHNSGWVQSPGAAVLRDDARIEALATYVRGVVGRFKHDPRIDGWDLVNEPDNGNGSSHGDLGNKADRAQVLLEKSFMWARACGPVQPLTAGLWHGKKTANTFTPLERLQIEQSDVITFHAYADLPHTRELVEFLKSYRRPVLCTEFMARPQGSTFDPLLGYFKDQNVGAYCWGFVAGKTNTIYPWDSWKKAYTAEPAPWFHDVLRADGTPYSAVEAKYIRSVTGAVERF